MYVKHGLGNLAGTFAGQKEVPLYSRTYIADSIQPQTPPLPPLSTVIPQLQYIHYTEGAKGKAGLTRVLAPKTTNF